MQTSENYINDHDLSSTPKNDDYERRFSFPLTLHTILDMGREDVISWDYDGLTFKVHQRERFAKEVLPVYFHTTKYNSFLRQLQLWGFAIYKKSGVKKGYCKGGW